MMQQRALLLGVLLGAGCQPAASVSLDLDKEPTVPPLETLMIVVRKTNGDTPYVYGPIKLSEQSQFKLQTEVPPDTRFFIDVTACEDPDSCQGELIVARGCTETMVLEKGESRSEHIQLFPNQGEADLEPIPGRAGTDMPERGCPPYGPHTRPADGG
ncbi:MAG: hypothetical protein AB2A00_36265 [Myxococcota bacterium]